jgi:hypothetical protein
MAITTLDGALAGMQTPWSFAKAATPALVAGRPHSLWYLAGAPGAAANPTTVAGGQTLTSGTAGGGFGSNTAGQIPRSDPSSGNSYLGRFAASATQAGTLLLCDRLMQIGGTAAAAAISVTTTTAQTITGNQIPARDQTGTNAGSGIQAALDVYAATGAGAATPTISYTNQSNTSGQTGSLVDTYVASSAIGAFHRFGLASGDYGIRSIQTLTLNVSMTSGNIALVLYRVLAALELPGALIPNAIDALTAGFPQLFVGTVPFLVFIPNTTTASNISGTYLETQG